MSKISQEWKDKIEKAVKQYPVMVYMRGTPKAARCGFSFRVIAVLDKLGKKYGVDFSTEDWDSDEKLRDTLKELNEWPTSPQIYVNGEFIGGCDIFVEMYQKGELQTMLN